MILQFKIQSYLKYPALCRKFYLHIFLFTVVLKHSQIYITNSYVHFLIFVSDYLWCHSPLSRQSMYQALCWVTGHHMLFAATWTNIFMLWCPQIESFHWQLLWTTLYHFLFWQCQKHSFIVDCGDCLMTQGWRILVNCCILLLLLRHCQSCRHCNCIHCIKLFYLYEECQGGHGEFLVLISPLSPETLYLGASPFCCHKEVCSKTAMLVTWQYPTTPQLHPTWTWAYALKMEAIGWSPCYNIYSTSIEFKILASHFYHHKKFCIHLLGNLPYKRIITPARKKMIWWIPLMAWLAGR